MRRRLIVSFVTLVVATILLFGVPRAFVIADFVTSTKREQVDRGADSAAAVARLAMQGEEEVTPDLLGPLLADGERVIRRLDKILTKYTGKPGPHVALSRDRRETRALHLRLIGTQRSVNPSGRGSWAFENNRPTSRSNRIEEKTNA